MNKLHILILIAILTSISCETQRTKSPVVNEYKCPIGEIAFKESIEKVYSDSIIKEGFQFSLEAEAEVKKILEIGGEFKTPTSNQLMTNRVKKKIDNRFSSLDKEVEKLFLYRLAYCNLLEHINAPENKSKYPDSIRIGLEKEYIEDFNSELFKLLSGTQGENLNSNRVPEKKYEVLIKIQRDEFLRGAKMKLNGKQVYPKESVNHFKYIAELSKGNHFVQLIPSGQASCRKMSFNVSDNQTVELNYLCN